VDFLGQRHDVESIVVGAKVFVLTSLSEGLSIAMAEAMAAGAVPVVANVGELGDLVEDGTSGFLVPPNDVEQYADRIVKLLEDGDAWSRMSSAAAESAASRCGIDVVSAQWRECLGETIKRASRSSSWS
jgi:glycosyltransferase involved in cell wall biosynthesis